VSEVTDIMRREGIHSIVMMPGGEGFSVLLNCGGPKGYGKTFKEALEQALELNADFLELRVTI
jgi:hypothetical protein